MRKILYTYRKQDTHIFLRCQPRIQLEDLCPIPRYLRKQSRSPGFPVTFFMMDVLLKDARILPLQGTPHGPNTVEMSPFIAVRFRVSNSQWSNKSLLDIHKKSICFATFQINVRFDRGRAEVF